MNYEPVPPPPPRTWHWRWGTAIAWILILASAAALIVRPRWMSHHPAGADSLPSIADTPSPQLQLIGRYVVGVQSLSGDEKLAATMLPQVEQAAANAVDEFRVIPIVGELSGKDAAIARLDAFEKNHHVVRLREDVDALRVIYTKGADHLTANQSQLLVDRHHWFGKLAISFGLDKEDPTRLAAMQPASRSVIVMALAALGGGVALIAGIVLLIIAIVLLVQRKIVRAYKPPASNSGLFIEAFALYLAGMVVVSQILARVFSDPALWVNFFLFGLLPVAWFYLRLRGAGWAEMMRDLGWHRGRGFWREVGFGIIGYITGLPILAIGFVITFILMKLTGNTPSHPIQNAPVAHPIEIIQVVLLACVGAPIVEETFFRGALFGHLRAHIGWWISAPLVSLLFAAIHPQGWVAIPVLGAIAMVLAGLREWRGSLIASMTAHALNNGVAVLMLVLLMN
jgi:membrane protease YdiL (CAAX protease family)